MLKKSRAFALALILTASIMSPARQDALQGNKSQNTGSASSEMGQSMEKMQVEMQSTKLSGNADIDFARLMLSHHRAAIDMAKTELLHGKNPQMRKLAQEIVTDQQSEIEVMELWLKQNDAPRKD